MAGDSRLVAALVGWFLENRRELPWRRVDGKGRRDGYAALVSELMLQQTQVSRVMEKFGAFMERFPDVGALAAADEAAVLGAWSGLGYYRRARLLHAAAKAVVKEHGGRLPRTVKELEELPGIGRYTAGAIASIAFGEAAPIVDGNVMRVLLRVHGKDLASDDRSAAAWAWERAEELALAAHGAGTVAAFNEGLMELGATVCTPGMPDCGRCPLAKWCVARRDGTQGEIPRPKTANKRMALWCVSVVARDARGRVLVEKRGDEGMWAGLWQAPTVERADREATAAEMAKEFGVAARELKLLTRFKHGTTHRDVEFVVYAGAGMRAGNGRVWKSAREIAGLGVSNAQRRVLEMDK